MKIEVRTPDLIGPIVLVFPTNFIKSKLIWKAIEKHADWEDKDLIRQYQPLMVMCSEALTEYVRENGHFNLVEVIQPDGTKVTIRL